LQPHDLPCGVAQRQRIAGLQLDPVALDGHFGLRHDDLPLACRDSMSKKHEGGERKIVFDLLSAFRLIEV
jgi:hypothetical protein